MGRRWKGWEGDGKAGMEVEGEGGEMQRGRQKGGKGGGKVRRKVERRGGR